MILTFEEMYQRLEAELAVFEGTLRDWNDVNIEARSWTSRKRMLVLLNKVGWRCDLAYLDSCEAFSERDLSLWWQRSCGQVLIELNTIHQLFR